MNPSSIRPIGAQILVRFLKSADPKPGEFYIPGGTDTGPQRAEIVALGSGARDERGRVVKFEVQVGDIVLLDRYIEGTELKQNGERYFLLRQEAILGLEEKC